MNYKDKYKDPKYFTNKTKNHLWKVKFDGYFPAIYIYYTGIRPNRLWSKKEVADWFHDSAILSEEDGLSFLSDKIEISFEEAEHIIKKKLMMKELIK